MNSNTQPKPKFSTKQTYIRTDGWIGYYQPVYAVAGANDTGMYSDSPCPTAVAKSELNDIKKVLRKNGIHVRSMVARTSNVFCIHRYLIVLPDDMEKARELVTDHLNSVSTRLVYVA